jgi:NTP pyrophosphatase (non-canonical NTP hydrolase)
MDDLADTFMWFLSFVAQAHQSENQLDKHFRIELKPSDLIWNKYPGRCPACIDFHFAEIVDAAGPNLEPLKALELARPMIEEWISTEAGIRDSPVPCQCLSRIAFAETRHQKYKELTADFDYYRIKYAEVTRRAGKKKEGMDELEAMFEGLFGQSYQVFSVQSVAFHLLEEVGEICQALVECYTFNEARPDERFSDELYKHRKMKLEEEIADVFSWIHALLLKIKQVYYRDAQEYFQTLLAAQDNPVRMELHMLEAISLPNVIWAKYGVDGRGNRQSSLRCKGCGEAPCGCQRDLKIDWSSENP